MQRRFTTLLIPVLALLLVAACSSGSDDGSTGSGADATFEFWSFTGINQKADVERYTKAHPDRKVKLTEVGSTAETAQALTTALAGGKVPDLALVQADDLPKFMQTPDNFVDLGSLGADTMKGDYLDWVITQSSTKDGRIFGIPTDVGGLAVAYRTDLFEAAGLPTNRDEVSKLWPTWEAFIETGKRYVQATGKSFLDNAPTSIYFQVVNQGAERYYDNTTHKPSYDQNPQVKTAFDLTLTTIAANITAKQNTFSSGWTAGLGKGDFAVVSAPSWMLKSIRLNAPATEGKWDVATIPGGAGNWGGSFLVIPKRAKHPKAAWDYIAAMQSPAGQLEQFLTTGSLPTTPSVYTDQRLLDKKDSFFSDAPTGKIFTESVRNLKPFHFGPEDGTIGTEFLNVLTSVEQGKVAPDKAWSTSMSNVKNAIRG